jgi:hypothetical protein
LEFFGICPECQARHDEANHRLKECPTKTIQTAVRKKCPTRNSTVSQKPR